MHRIEIETECINRGKSVKNVYDLTKYIYPQKWDLKKLRKARKKSFLFLLISKFFPIPLKKRELLKNQQFLFLRSQNIQTETE